MRKKSKRKIFTGVVFRPVGSTFQGLFRKKTLHKFCNFDAVEKFDEQKTDDTFDGEMSGRKKPIFFPRVYKKIFLLIFETRETLLCIFAIWKKTEFKLFKVFKTQDKEEQSCE